MLRCPQCHAALTSTTDICPTCRHRIPPLPRSVSAISPRKIAFAFRGMSQNKNTTFTLPSTTRGGFVFYCLFGVARQSGDATAPPAAPASATVPTSATADAVRPPATLPPPSCDTCGSRLHAHERFCPQCGTEVATGVQPPEHAPVVLGHPGSDEGPSEEPPQQAGLPSAAGDPIPNAHNPPSAAARPGVSDQFVRLYGAAEAPAPSSAPLPRPRAYTLSLIPSVLLVVSLGYILFDAVKERLPAPSTRPAPAWKAPWSGRQHARASAHSSPPAASRLPAYSVYFFSARGSGNQFQFLLYSTTPDGKTVTNHKQRIPDAYYDWSLYPDGKGVVGIKEAGVSQKLCLFDFASGRERLVVTKTEDRIESPVMSHDGATIAYVYGPEGRKEIYTIESNGAHERRLVSYAKYGSCAQPSFSFDDNRVLFLATAAPDKSVICQVETDGSHLEKITPKAGGYSHPVYSPDSRTIAFVDQDARTDERGIFTLNLTTAHATCLFRPGNSPRFSPDGQAIIFTEPAHGNLLFVSSIHVDKTGYRRLSSWGEEFDPICIPHEATGL
jgi:hypothetical protein